MGVRPRIKQATKVRSILQQEINSICPFCDSKEVGHFEIHHIDENPENNFITNLLLVCPTCHSKITKGDIAKDTVEHTKRILPIRDQAIEIGSIGIDRENCSWESYDDFPNAFVEIESSRSRFPILNFSLINHSSKTILLTEIALTAKHLFSGLSGIPTPSLLKPIAKFKIEIKYDEEGTKFKLPDEIQVPAGQAFKFQVQLFNADYPIEGKNVLYFTFNFNNSVSIIAPTIFLNCKSENEKMQLRILL